MIYDVAFFGRNDNCITTVPVKTKETLYIPSFPIREKLPNRSTDRYGY
jgi:hypothetical protein